MPTPLGHRRLTPNVACLLRLSDAALRTGLAWGALLTLGLGVHALCVTYRGQREWGVDGAVSIAAATAAASGGKKRGQHCCTRLHCRACGVPIRQADMR